MKKFIKVLLLGLFLVSGMGAGVASTKSNTVVVTNQQVISYLGNLGYRNVVVIQVMSDGSRLCDTAFPYNTMVYVSGDNIVGSEDMGQN